jgi:hypothetical protein
MIIPQVLASPQPSNGTDQNHYSLFPGIASFMITSTIAIVVLLLTSHKRYQQYRFRRQVQMLEKVWKQSQRKRMH